MILMDVKYEVKFYCCDGREGFYKGNTIVEVHKQIDDDLLIKNTEKSILKYGYFYEFKDKGYKTSSYVVDNGFHCIWKVNNEEGKMKLIINKLKGLLNDLYKRRLH